MKMIKWMVSGLMIAGIVQAAEVDVTVDFASAYVSRGVTINRNPVMQIGAEISGFPMPEEYGSLVIGTWGNFDLSRGGTNYGWKRNEFSEIDYYVSYAFPVTGLDLSIDYWEYTYPNSDARADREVIVSVGKEIPNTGLYANLDTYHGLAGGMLKNTYVETGLSYGMDLSEALSASVGTTVAYLFNNSGPDGLHNATLGAGLGYALTENWSVSGSVTFIAQLDNNALPSGPFGYDRKVVGMLGVAYSF